MDDFALILFYSKRKTFSAHFGLWFTLWNGVMNGVTLIVRCLWYCYNCGNRNDEDADDDGGADEMMADG